MAGKTQQSGIYAIRCLPTGTVYVGSSKRIDRRFWQHRHDLVKNRHKNKVLQAAWNDHGAGAFVFGVLELVEVAGLAAAEKRHLDAVRASGPVFNVSEWPNGNERPRKMAPEIDWSAIDWRTKNNKQIAREIGCSDGVIARRRPPGVPSPWAQPEYRSAVALKHIARLSPSERAAMGRALCAKRGPAQEAKRIEASRKALSKAHLFVGVDWNLLTDKEIARRLGVSKTSTRNYRPAATPSPGKPGSPAFSEAARRGWEKRRARSAASVSHG